MNGTVGFLELGALAVDTGRYSAALGGRVLELSRSELELLALLIATPHRVLSRQELSARLGLAQGRSVDVLLSRLRHLIGRDFVRNVRGRGWIVVPEALSA